MGLAYSGLNDYPNAIDYLNRYINSDTTNDTAFYNRGLAYYYQKKYRKALNDYDRAIRLIARSSTEYSTYQRARERAQYALDETSLNTFFATNRFFSIGATAGVSSDFLWNPEMAQGRISPLITVSPIKHSILELGCDIGFFNKNFQFGGDSLFSLFSPFAHIGVLLGDKSFFYLGGGASALIDKDITQDSINDYRITLDGWGGAYFGKRHHYLNLAYTFYTRFWDDKYMAHKLAVGYNYRF
jgi:tetratricopeptide (TPR) repeat protein